MHEISISGDVSEVDFVSVSDVISACDFNDKYFFIDNCCSRSIVADISIRIIH